MKITIRCLLCCAFVLGSSAAAADRSDDQAKACASASGNLAVSACTGVIKSRRWSAASHAIAFNNRGVAYFGLAQYQRAIRDYDRAIALNSNYAEAFNNRGNAYNSLDQYARAIADLDRAIALKPGYAHAYYNRGDAYVSLRLFARAAADYDAAIAHQVDYAKAYGGRCWARAALGQQLLAALTDCAKYLTRRPNDADTLDSRGLVRFRMGDFVGAIVDTSAALSMKPKLASSLYVRGLAKLRIGDVAGGTSDVAMAQRTDPKIARTYAGYGVTP